MHSIAPRRIESVCCFALLTVEDRETMPDKKKVNSFMAVRDTSALFSTDHDIKPKATRQFQSRKPAKTRNVPRVEGFSGALKG